MEIPAQIEALQERIGYRFKKPQLLVEGMLHPSHQQDNPNETRNNQRLEFLGDAVLELILTEKLFHLFPTEREGPLTKHRAILAKGRFLSDLAKRIGLTSALLMSQSELKRGGNRRPSSLEDAFEALVGAIYLDSDYPTTRRLVLGWYGDISAIIKDESLVSNPKGRLQELVQPRLGNDALSYRITGELGEAHARKFEVELYLHDKLLAKGSGLSKKEAEEEAARRALTRWTKEGKWL